MTRSSRNTTVAWIATATAASGLVVAATALWWRKNRRVASEERPHETDDRGPVRDIQWSNHGALDTEPQLRRILTRGCVTIVHGSVTGTCAQFATTLYQSLLSQTNRTVSHVQLASIADFDWWDELINDETTGPGDDTIMATLIVLLPTYTNGTWPPVATPLQEALHELQHDWRISAKPVKHKLQAAVFGMGSSAYNSADTANTTSMDNTMGQPAKQAVKALQQLGAKVLVQLAVGDDAVGHHAHTTFTAWHASVVAQLTRTECACASPSSPSTAPCGHTTAGTDTHKQGGDNSNHDELEPIEENDDVDEFDDFDDDEDDEDDDDPADEPDVMDLEDIGDAMAASRRTKPKGLNEEPREMVTPSQAVALKKEGYKLIGTHSAVKLCRWTKHQLRGRGGCYKHTFYGITSYQCMEATPSLACANKCVFCWRHHKNPVGKEWRWKTDDPYYIVDQAVQTHVQMIKETRGIPGVQLDRWHEAHTVKHCALSLVGEPIMYPRIDELLGELHHRDISTFLVTNGQHPQAISTLRPITQLYVSVDAPTEPSLIAIDRPLFSDAWDRLKQSLASLKDKGQRTVARLTVVKGWNSDEVSGYAQLIALGEVSLVEVKGVTFCGKSDASNLNMTNSPWHHEVVELTRTLQQELAHLRSTTHPNIPEYDLACEHKHSCSVLLARVDQFADDSKGSRQWRTWIDYDKFQQLAARHVADPNCTFTVQDYTAPTPDWALFGAVEEGFDPTDRRHRKQTKHPKYTRFDAQGVPTHDENNSALHNQERERLTKMMKDRKRQIGDGSTVTELRGGEKEILDASLMFRGLVVAK